MKEIIKLIGNTPVYRIENTNIYVKLEKFNVGGSIQDRTVFAMLEHALQQGDIKEDTILIEATSGNTGIALAVLGAAYKIPVTIVMPDTMSIEKKQLIQAYGAQLILTDGTKGMKGALEKVEELMQQDPHYVTLRPFDNEVNVNIHYETTGNEILRQVPNIDIFVTCAETGGSFSGISKRLKEYKETITCVIGEPENSSVISGHEPGKHIIQGIGAGFTPSILNHDYIDDIMMVSDDDAIKETIAFVKETGVFVGLSSGANIALAKRLASYYPDKVIVTLAPDGGEKYLSILNL